MMVMIMVMMIHSDDTDSCDNDNDDNDHADNDTHTHPAGGLFVGHLMLVASLHLQPLACPNHLDISSSRSFIRSLYRDYFELPKFKTFVSKTHLGARWAGDLSFEESVAALGESRISKNLLENGRGGPFHLQRHLETKRQVSMRSPSWRENWSDKQSTVVYFVRTYTKNKRRMCCWPPFPKLILFFYRILQP